MVPGVCLPSMSCTAHAGRAQRSCGASIRPVQHSRLLGTDKHSFGGAVQRRRGSTCVARSFLGVGAPEAILIVVVSLAVFGPKGLAEAAKSVGSALKAFTPTLREVASISSDLKTTLEEEIGLDDIKREFNGVAESVYRPTTSGSRKGGGKGLPSDEEARQLDPTIDDLRKRSAEMAWASSKNGVAATDDATERKEEKVAERPEAPPAKKSLADLSVDELEAELAARKAKQNS